MHSAFQGLDTLLLGIGSKEFLASLLVGTIEAQGSFFLNGLDDNGYQFVGFLDRNSPLLALHTPHKTIEEEVHIQMLRGIGAEDFLIKLLEESRETLRLNQSETVAQRIDAVLQLLSLD